MSADTQRNQELAFIGQQLERIASALEASIPQRPTPPAPEPTPAPLMEPIDIRTWLKMSEAEQVETPAHLVPAQYRRRFADPFPRLRGLADELADGAQ